MESHKIEQNQQYIKEKDLEKMNPKFLAIDLSCNESMGFFFAKPTTFNNLMFKVWTIDYYGFNHASNYLWDSATRSISKSNK